mmetsp:Transcript_137140/g.382505  ORF Transcript_137140/g.382505 Transcript_137140/m.382505 type:complete len:325 (-) Transcript_137140:362-1336(-)
MVRISVKNTFLTLGFDDTDEWAGEEDAPLDRRQAPRASPTRSVEAVSPIKRSRSAECRSPDYNHEDDQQELQIKNLNRLLDIQLSPCPALASSNLSFVSDEAPETPEDSEGGSGWTRSGTMRQTWSSMSLSTMDSLPLGTGSTVASEEQCQCIVPKQGSKDYCHRRVPKNKDLLQAYSFADQDRPPTTLMIRNIPNRLNQQDLIAELEDLGFAGTFDFLYLPLDQGRKHRHHGTRKAMSNVGYAFVNFVNHSWAERCMDVFRDHTFQGSAKRSSVSVAHVQGLEANLAHYRTAAVNNAKMRQCRPVVMANISQAFDGCVSPAPR